MDTSNVVSYTISNKHLSLTMLNIGCIITQFSYDGQNMVLAYDDIKNYFNNDCYLGVSLIGRTSGRISDSKISIDSKTYQLEKNWFGHNLHGGFSNFDCVFYDVEVSETSLKFSRIDYEGEHGFPGNLKIVATYTLEGTKLIQDVRIVSDKKTVVNPTNHSYYNLGSSTCLDLRVTLNSDSCYYVDSSMMPYERHSTNKSIFAPLNDGAKLKDIMIECNQFNNTKFVDHPFTYSNKVIIENDNYALEISSNRNSFVMYTGNYLNAVKHKINGKIPYEYMGLCIEMQHIPNLIDNQVILDVGDELQYSVEYNLIKK